MALVMEVPGRDGNYSYLSELETRSLHMNTVKGLACRDLRNLFSVEDVNTSCGLYVV